MEMIANLVVIMGICLMVGCATTGPGNDANELVVGGLYVTPNENGSFGVSKILAMDESTVHLRMYAEEFEQKPDELKSAALSAFIGHAPLAKEGFLLEQPELVTVEKVSEEELEGYKYYLEAMENQ